MNVHLGIQKGKIWKICYMFFNCTLNHENANIGKMKNDVSKLFVSSVLLPVLSTGLQVGRKRLKANKINSGKSTKN